MKFGWILTENPFLPNSYHSYQIPTNPTKFRSEFGRNCQNAWGSVKYSLSSGAPEKSVEISGSSLCSCWCVDEVLHTKIQWCNHYIVVSATCFNDDGHKHNNHKHNDDGGTRGKQWCTASTLQAEARLIMWCSRGFITAWWLSQVFESFPFANIVGASESKMKDDKLRWVRGSRDEPRQNTRDWGEWSGGTSEWAKRQASAKVKLDDKLSMID